MNYIHVSPLQTNAEIYDSIRYRFDKLCFQRIRQVDKNNYEYSIIPLDTCSFIGFVREAMFPGKSANPYPQSNNDRTTAESFIINTSGSPGKEAIPDEEVSTSLRIQDDGSLLLSVCIGDDDLQHVLDRDKLEQAYTLINEIGKDLQRQIMVLKSSVMAASRHIQFP